jgi:hypothetical protein
MKTLRTQADNLGQKAKNVVSEVRRLLKGCGCFTAGTEVLLADGQTKAVEDVQPGDQVAARDPETGANQAEAVADTYTRDAAPTITVATYAGEVTTTANHPFWEDGGQTWTPAGRLEPGDRLLAADGRTVAVNSVAVTGRVETVHNFQVKRLHNYYVAAGNTTILVHNTNKPGDTCPMPTQPPVRGAG